MEPRPLWKLFYWATFMEEFCEVRAVMQESNREVGIISSDSYYFFYIITVNENSYVRKLKDMTFFKGVRHGLRILKKYPSYFKFVICSPW